jgi:DNA-binding NarL/FixJ family response regulator
MFRVLIVEDNLQFRLSLQGALQRRFPFIILEEAATGPEVVSKIVQMKLQVVFMDVRIPLGNGLELTQRIKRLWSDTTVVVLTSYDVPEYRYEAERCGADHFLVKGSASNAELWAPIESHLETRFRTLIVEDDPAARELMAASFGQTWPDMVIVEAKDEGEASTFVDSLKPHLVVLGGRSAVDHGADMDTYGNAVLFGLKRPIEGLQHGTNLRMAIKTTESSDLIAVVDSAMCHAQQSKAGAHDSLK